MSFLVKDPWSRCNFPFQYNSEVYFEPVEVDNKKKCNTAKRTKKNSEYIDYALEDLEECMPCKEGDGTIDWSSRFYTGIGFALKNEGGTNSFHNLTLSECQKLCEITENCLYFKLNESLTETNCQLYYGMGHWELSISSLSKMYFGHKYNPSMIEILC